MSADGILIMSPRNRQVLREAGEHVGTLAEEAKLVYERYVGQRGAKRTAISFYSRYVRLTRLSKELLELAND